MSSVPTPTTRRHAWGLPAGSIRAIIALSILGLMWGMALLHRVGDSGPNIKLPLEFIYLTILMVLMVVHFITAHGKTYGKQVSTHQPLGLPGGTVRFVLVAGFLGLAGYLYYHRQTVQFDIPEQFPFLLLLELLALLLTAYFVGWLIAAGVRVAWGDNPPAAWQDVQAWVAILAMLCLAGVVVAHLINLGVSPEVRIPLDWAELILVSLVGLYFGARS